MRVVLSLYFLICQFGVSERLRGLFCRYISSSVILVYRKGCEVCFVVIFPHRSFWCLGKSMRFVLSLYFLICHFGVSERLWDLFCRYIFLICHFGLSERL